MVSVKILQKVRRTSTSYRVLDGPIWIDDWLIGSPGEQHWLIGAEIITQLGCMNIQLWEYIGGARKAISQPADLTGLATFDVREHNRASSRLLGPFSEFAGHCSVHR